ncbi:MFS general substrate transporter [Choiromyces venosus 120613-1]|uniref:MFS general substrate transporter n=1 Tax=Choiromyces venosus 120613-1 TaxID=1336337 RepID=A0A3N4JB81_9PEZI|nr:MFS general substrate transporter [Choiromyces venosus 120613-1]
MDPATPDKIGLQSTQPPSLNPSQNTIQVHSTSAMRPTDEEKQSLTKAEKRAKWKYRGKLLVGLIFPFFLNSMDVTIIATALPHIATYFNQLTQQSWIVTSFTLTSTAFIPAFGQLSDVFGRHATLQFVIFLMLVGSGLCAGAQSFEMLLVGRAITGVSSAGLLVMMPVILSDKVSLKDNAMQNTLFSLVAGASYSVGPVIGGQLTNVNWRWCFGLSIPLCLFSHMAIFFVLKPELIKAQRHIDPDTGEQLSKGTSMQKISVIDWPGLALFLVACIAIILALTWGGATYAWHSAQVVILLVLGGILFLIFVWVEHSMEPGRWLERKVRVPGKQAMIPVHLFYEKDIVILAFLKFACGATLYAMFYFISVYFAIVEQFSASKAGLQLLLYLPGIGVGVSSAMYLCNISPRTTFPPLLLGHIALPISIGILTTALQSRNQSLIYGMMALSGFGNGITFMPVPLHAIAKKPAHLAVIVGTIKFFEPFGGTVAMAVMGSVLNNKLGAFGVEFSRGGGGGGVIAGLEFDNEIRMVVKDGVKWAFIAILPLVTLAAVAVLFLGDVRIDEGGVVEEMAGGRGRRWGVKVYYEVVKDWMFGRKSG